MENKNDITIGDLARMVQKGFNGVDLRFDKVDQRFDKVDQRFDRIDQRFDKVEDRLETIEKLLIVNHRERIERLEIEVKELKELLAVK